MDIKDVKKVGIVGCGIMGPTIAAAIAPKYPVIVKEVNKKLADKGFQSHLQLFSSVSKAKYAH